MVVLYLADDSQHLARKVEQAICETERSQSVIVPHLPHSRYDVV